MPPAYRGFMTIADKGLPDTSDTRKVRPPPVLYKYTTVETARSILSTGRLRFQSPLRYNDPFDSQWDTLWQTKTPEAEARIRQLVIRAILDPSCWPETIGLRWRRSLENEHKRLEGLSYQDQIDNIEAQLQPFLDSHMKDDRRIRLLLDHLRRLRVQCLSETDMSIQMWSHYAEQHRGVVLAFDVQQLQSSFPLPIRQVQYCDGPPECIDLDKWLQGMVFGIPYEPDYEKVTSQHVLSKHAGWRYECEWRVVFGVEPEVLGDYGDFEFRRSAVLEVVAGCRTDETRFKELASLSLAFNPNVVHSRMVVHPSRFELVKTPR